MRSPTKEELHEEAMGTKSTETRPLWAVAAEEYDPRTKRWDLIIRYNHAENAWKARATYAQARGTLPFKIIEVGRAIGFKINDNQGLALSA